MRSTTTVVAAILLTAAVGGCAAGPRAARDQPALLAQTRPDFGAQRARVVRSRRWRRACPRWPRCPQESATARAPRRAMGPNRQVGTDGSECRAPRGRPPRPPRGAPRRPTVSPVSVSDAVTRRLARSAQGPSNDARGCVVTTKGHSVAATSQNHRRQRGGPPSARPLSSIIARRDTECPIVARRFHGPGSGRCRADTSRKVSVECSSISHPRLAQSLPASHLRRSFLCTA